MPPEELSAMEKFRQNQQQMILGWHKEFYDLWLVRTAAIDLPPDVAQHFYDAFLDMAARLVPQLPQQPKERAS